jgi:D-arabinose 1-dehydrogenase-like Zn-dependent alcohol dehydrogenase
MSKMRVVQVPHPNGPFELVERGIPEPGTGSVRIKVQACGICHSDSMIKEGTFPNIQYPRVPGHEVVGFIDAVGRVLPNGQLASGSAWAGMAVTAAPAIPAVAASFLPAKSPRR